MLEVRNMPLVNANSTVVEHVHNVHALPSVANDESLALNQAADPTQNAIANLDDAIKTINEALKIANRADDPDPGALFSDDVLAALGYIYTNSRMEWARTRQKLKKCRVIKLSDLEKAIFAHDETATEDSSEGDADLLIALASEMGSFFRDEDRKAYASYIKNEISHFCAIKGEEYTDFLTCEFLKLTNKAPNPAALRSAINTLSAKAKFEGECVKVHLRVAKDDAGAYWIDLCNDKYQAVRITAVGWQVVDNPEVKFIRSSTMRALPTPIAGTGNLEHFWKVTNFQEKDQLLLITAMIESLRPDTPYQIITIVGEQGSAKSSSHEKLRELIDPSKNNLRSAANKRDDIIVSTASNHVISYENLSSLTAEVQDLFCTFATGGGFSKRQWYTDSDEVSLIIKRPVMLNSINNVITAQDAVDRLVYFYCPPLTHTQSEIELNAYWQKNYAATFTGLMDEFVKALAHLPQVDLKDEQLSRQNDLTLLGEAVYLAHGHPPKTFFHEFTERRKQNVSDTLDASPVADAMINYLKHNPDGFTGNMAQLIKAIDPYKPEKCEGWVKSAKAMGDAIQRLKPALRKLGVSLTKDAKRTMNGYQCALMRDGIEFPEES
jgi:hypothetical protein